MTSYKCNRYYGDIFERQAIVQVDKRLASMPAAQAGIIEREDGSILLISYATVAADIDKDGNLTISCLCSATTRKHVSAFLKEYCPGISYQTAKALFADEKSMNVYTGEVKDIAA